MNSRMKKSTLLLALTMLWGINQISAQVQQILTGEAPLAFTSTGSGTYNKSVLYHSYSRGFRLELAKLSNSNNSNPIDFFINARGGMNHFFTVKGENGNIGIGTSTPESKLHVYGHIDGAFNGLVIDNRKIYGPNSGINQTSRILLSLSENKVPNPLSRIFGIIEAGTVAESSSANGRLSFYVRQNGNASEKMRIAHNGNVGIGTFTPESKLHIYGQIDGAFNGLVIDNRKIYGPNSGINQTSRILLSLSENKVPNPLSRIFGIIEAGTVAESSSANGRLSFYVRQNGNPSEKMRITHNGNVGIGTDLSSNPNNYKLAVNGTIGAKEIKVELNSSTWSDFVFEENYELENLETVSKFIKENKHLPNIPTAEEVKEKGVNLVQMDAKLLQKIEELTLYVIEQSRRNSEQAIEIEILKKRINELEK